MREWIAVHVEIRMVKKQDVIMVHVPTSCASSWLMMGEDSLTREL